MEPILSDQDRDLLDRRIKDAEKRTKAQIVAAVAKRSDSYAELPWKAFAFGASVTGLLVGVFGVIAYCMSPDLTLPLTGVAAVLVVGALFALLTVLVPGFARLFLSAHRAEAEVRQYAQSFFLERELFATTGRTGILLLVSLFERRVMLLPDKGLSHRLSGNATEEVIASMRSYLARNEIGRALEAGLDRLTVFLDAGVPSGPAVGIGKDELPDEVVEEKGV